jgi:tetratricopeptide (TPR) repeat protein
MKIFIYIVKVLFVGLFFVYSIILIYPLFFAPKAERLEQAEKKQGQYFSQKLFDILIFQNPDFDEAYFGKSIPHNKRGDYEKGFTILNKALQIDSRAHLGYRGWIKLRKLKDYQGCIHDLKKLDFLTPNFVDAPWGENIHYLLGQSYKGLKQYDLALKEFDENLNTEKDSSWVDPNLFLYKGIIYNELREYNRAIKNFDACLTSNYNNSSEAYFHKGIAFKKLNEIDSAKTCFKKAEELFNKGYKIKDIYNEVQDELYLSDILEELEYFDE